MHLNPFKLILHISNAKMVPLNFGHNIRINLCKVEENLKLDFNLLAGPIFQIIKKLSFSQIIIKVFAKI